MEYRNLIPQIYENNTVQNMPTLQSSPIIPSPSYPDNYSIPYYEMNPAPFYFTPSLPTLSCFSYASTPPSCYPVPVQPVVPTATWHQAPFPHFTMNNNLTDGQCTSAGSMPATLPDILDVSTSSKRSFANSFSSSLSDSGAAKILCQLGKDSSPCAESDQALIKSYGHVLCIGCHQRIPLSSSEPPPCLRCLYCGLVFPIVRRFIHEYSYEDDDASLELPFLRGLVDPTERQRQIQCHLQSVLTSRKCSYSSSLRDIQRMVTHLVNKVDRMITKEQKMIEDECAVVMNVLLTRTEEYLRGDLHCCCFQPAYFQRHFIQCDVCNIWYHTSCVGLDSRKVATMPTYICPWCNHGQEVEEPVEVEEDCICPYCNRSFPRPCNLSRHLHAKHNIKWDTHRLLNIDLDDYLEMTLPSKQSFRTANKTILYEGCFVSTPSLEGYDMTLSHFRFLLRKLKAKHPHWWIGKEIHIWDKNQQTYRLARIKTTRPRNEYIIQFRNGCTCVVNNLFDPSWRIRLLILNGYYELELFHAFPTTHIRDIKNDLKLYIC